MNLTLLATFPHQYHLLSSRRHGSDLIFFSFLFSEEWQSQIEVISLPILVFLCYFDWVCILNEPSLSLSLSVSVCLSVSPSPWEDIRRTGRSVRGCRGPQVDPSLITTVQGLGMCGIPGGIWDPRIWQCSGWCSVWKPLTENSQTALLLCNPARHSQCSHCSLATSKP